MVAAHRLALTLVTALILAVPIAYAWYGQRQGTASPSPALELVLFEADGCLYCDVLRREVAPLYATTAEARRVPLRFFNVSRTDESAAGRLDRAITIAPTAVLLRDGRESARIAGYTGLDMLVQLASLAAAAD